MRKSVALLLALLLALPLGALGENILNPDGYGLLYVTDMFITEDSEADENGDFPPAVQELIVQAAFGDVTGEADETELVGFDDEAVCALGVAEGCAFLLPADLNNPVENAPCANPAKWFADASTWYVAMAEDSFGFFATFELDANGDLTRLEYAYFP